ncbi:alpha/beta hydrolase [Aliamphritea hakodatensis]|uniref:alpha/beta hydrolase n=1 Tax=Aliamphritea hakodatensis TaxID=2895352 RepID=UPI0022FD48D2|nr:alpha/beta fold hydrolase [Aliamphritea hakodatensis]
MTLAARAGNDDFYRQLHAALGNTRALQQRECLQLTNADIRCELYRSASASDPLVIFFPGLSAYAELYAGLLASLAEQGFNVVGVDPPGHGYSGGTAGSYLPEDVQRITSQILDVLEDEFSGPKVAFGHSVGGMLALAAAEHDPRIQAVICQTLLVTEVPPDWWHFWGWQWIRGSAQWLPQWPVPLHNVLNFRQLISGHPAQALLEHDPLLVMAYPLRTLAGLFSHRAGIMRQAYPFRLLVIQGEDDRVLSAHYAKRVAEQSVHQIEMITVSGEGHMLPLQSPPKLTGIVGKWLRKAL